MRRSAILALVLLGLPLAAAAAYEQAPAEPRQWTSVEIILSVGILVFAIVVLLLQAILIAKARANWSPDSITRTIGLTLIVSAGLFLITAGYSADQVSPFMGLLGTVAGYLLGSTEARTKTG